MPMGDETIRAALEEEGGQRIFNDAVLRRLGELEKHNKVTDNRLDTLEQYQAPIREISDVIRRFLIRLIVLALLGLVVAEATGFSDLSNLLDT